MVAVVLVMEIIMLLSHMFGQVVEGDTVEEVVEETEAKMMGNMEEVAVPILYRDMSVTLPAQITETDT